MGEILFVSIFVAGPIFIVACVFGLFIPKIYVLKSSAIFDTTKEEVWKIVTDFENYPRWLSYVSVMTCEDAIDQIWLQEGSIVPIKFRVKESRPTEFLELEVVSTNVPVIGGRRFEIEAIGPRKTCLTVSQSGSVTHSFLRSYLFLFHRKPDPVAIYIKDIANRVRADVS